MFTEVIFYAPENAEMMVGAESIRPEKRNPGSGTLIKPSGLIRFRGGLYRTSDPKEIKLLRNTNSFTIGKIREITEDEAAILAGVRTGAGTTEMATSEAGGAK